MPRVSERISWESPRLSAAAIPWETSPEDQTTRHSGISSRSWRASGAIEKITEAPDETRRRSALACRTMRPSSEAGMSSKAIAALPSPCSARRAVLVRIRVASSADIEPRPLRVTRSPARSAWASTPDMTSCRPIPGSAQMATMRAPSDPCGPKKSIATRSYGVQANSSSRPIIDAADPTTEVPSIGSLLSFILWFPFDDRLHFSSS